MESYIYSYIPAVYLYAIGDAQRKFLNGMGKTSLPLFC
jgi:hypothetical protein